MGFFSLADLDLKLDSTMILKMYAPLISFLDFIIESDNITTYTLTDPNASCPRSLLKTTPPPPGCPWVPGGPEVTPEPSFRGLVLDHQV